MNPEHPPVPPPSGRQPSGQTPVDPQPPGREPVGWQAPDGRAPTAEDEATRLLSAAAHADDEFADAISDEYLWDRRRAAPPSPGVNAATVLREVIRARGRRLWRDGVTLVLFFLVLWLWWPLSVLWLVLAAVLGVVAGGRKIGVVGWATVRKQAYFAVLALVVAISLPFLATAFVAYFLGFDGDGGSLAEVLGLFAAMALLGILINDQWHIRQLLATTFDRANFRRRQGGEPDVLDFSDPQDDQRLEQVEQNSNGNLIVHDGYRAFVGYGELLNAWSMVLHLRKKDADEQQSATTPPVQLDVTEIHRAVSEEVLRLRGAEGLAPGFRLAELTELEQVVVSSTALLQHRDSDSLARSILPDLNSAPRGFLPEAAVREVSTGRREWIRSYRGYQVDSWNRDLVVTAFLRISCGDGVLYLEWSVFRLNPIDDRYRWELWELASPRQTLGVALANALRYPLSLWARIKRLARAYWAVVRGEPRRVHPEVYGTRKSVREIAAANQPQNYFQDVDTVRYLRLLEERLLVAVRRCLERFGLSTEDFDQQRLTVVNNTVINGGQFSGVNLVGQGNQAIGNRAQGNQAQGGQPQGSRAPGNRPVGGPRG